MQDKQNTKQNQQTDEPRPQSVLRFVLRHAKGHVRWFVLAFGASILAVAANFLLPQIIRFTVDSVIGSEPVSLGGRLGHWANTLLLGGSTHALWACAGLMLGCSVIWGVTLFASRLGMATGTERVIKSLRGRLFRHVQYLPFKWHVENQTGDIIQRCTSDMDVIRNFVANQLLEVVRTLFLIVVALTLMFSMNVTLSLVALLFIPLIAVYSTVFYRLVGNRFLKADEAEGNLTVAVQENLTGVRVVRAFGRERYEMDRFDQKNERFANLWIRLGHILSFYWGIGDLATGLQIFSVVLVGAILAANGSITAGEFLVFVSYNQMLAWPVRSLGRVLSEMSKTGVSVGRIQQILDAPPEPEPKEELGKTPSLHTDIRFENVTFSYGNQTVLHNLSFTIKKGTTFGILGSTGSGKSTVTYLLNRLYDLPEGFGNIWFGDNEIRSINRYYLRKNVGLVLQEPFLFSKTVGENIAIAKEAAPLRELRRVAGIADVDDAISEFTAGYDTMVGERGVTLSGGQKQRVAIARTLMQNAPVMVFDDSLSAVDMETDARIRNALNEHTSDATVILISHRINTLMHADNIMVLEDGRITAMGTHAQLIRTPGLYQRIYNMQHEGDSHPAERGPN